MNEIRFLKELVAIPSRSGEESEAVDFLVSSMTGLGYNAFVDEVGNAVGVREMPDREGLIKNEILLLGHIDTVPGDIPVRIAGNCLYGRGAVDAKGPLAAFTIAAAHAQMATGTRLIVVGAVEEESATSRGARHIAQQYQPDYCIIGEPSGWDSVTLGYKGRLLIDYERHQPMSHTAGQAPGVAEMAVAWWNDLNQTIAAYNQDRSRLFDQLIPSIRHFNTKSDGLTNSALLKLGIRLPPQFDIDHFIDKASHLAGKAKLRCYAYEPAYQSTRRTRLAWAFNQVLRQAGIKPRFKLKTGTSDMNVVGPIWKCPILAYGPGDSSLDHSPDEAINLDEYQQSIDLLQQVLSVIPA